MDYEKKYKESLERARVKYAMKDQPIHQDLVDIFPELKESEDEKIRKQIKMFIISHSTNESNNKIDSWIAWLEKQGEPTAEEVLIKAGLKPYKDGNQWCVLVGDNIQEGICGFGDTIEDALYEFLKEVCEIKQKQGEQKHQYNSRPRYVGEEELLGTNKQGKKYPFLIQELIDMGFAFTQDSNLAYPIHRIENKEFASWKPSKEQLHILESVIADYENQRLSYTKDMLCDLYEQLKKL